MTQIITKLKAQIVLLLFLLLLSRYGAASFAPKTNNCSHARKSSARLDPDETICIDPAKDCVGLIHSVIRETFRSGHNTTECQSF